VLGEGAQRHVFGIFATTTVDGYRGRVFVIAECQRGVADVYLAPGGRQVFQAKRHVALTKYFAVKVRCRAAEGQAPAQQRAQGQM
jgi:hypothetical protein